MQSILLGPLLTLTQFCPQRRLTFPVTNEENRGVKGLKNLPSVINAEPGFEPRNLTCGPNSLFYFYNKGTITIRRMTDSKK